MSAHDAAHDHPSIRFYLGIGTVLTVATFIEVLPLFKVMGLSFGMDLPAWLLIGLSAMKFVLVVLFFMHLQFDDKNYRRLFFGGLLLAMAMTGALMTLFGWFWRPADGSGARTVAEIMADIPRTEQETALIIMDLYGKKPSAAPAHGHGTGDDGDHGAGDGGEPPPEPDAAPAIDVASMAGDQAAIDAGAGVFAANCVACHAADASGGIGPNLKDSTWIHGGKVTEIHHVITHGVAGTAMINWAPIVGDEGAAQVAAYVHSLGGGQ